MPSRLKSPTATDRGNRPTAKSLEAASDTVWACAGFSHATEQSNVAATGRDSLATLLIRARANHAARLAADGAGRDTEAGGPREARAVEQHDLRRRLPWRLS